MRLILTRSLYVLPVAAVALGGALWLAESAVPGGNVASVEMMQLVHDEHALVADYVKMDTEARRRAYASADQETAALRTAALEQNRQRLAQAERDAAAKVERKVAAVRAPVRIDQVAVNVPVAEPAPLPPVQNAVIAAAEPPRAEGPVRTRLREFVSDVRRVPGWFASAADWMAESVPVPRLPRLPGLPSRQFRAEL